MRRTHALAAAIAAAVLTGGAVGGTAIAHHGEGGGSHGRSHGTFTVIEHPDSDTVIDTGATGDTAGDLLPFANPIFDAADANQIGTDQGSCIRTQAHVSWECNYTTNLPGGSITVEGAYLDSGVTTVLAITGGTGRYATARGTMDLVTAGANFKFVFHVRR